ncbi:hypothetical protein P3875_05425 [Myroides sp. JBRI-B21084]|uniref:hypothetical protein n=1 Tax=Myroides sp. JBRI-B21084 TaxID=3119977 RepID=UPI0026E19A9C|nr:hypothetical protein [Paenimyroides cloacae]WKW47494.1 hypothetical protein P3875_05425 [Paenimyroides cloacae]
MKKSCFVLFSILLFACNKKTDKTKITSKTSTEMNQLVEETDTIDISKEEKKLLNIYNDSSASTENVRNDSLIALYSQKFSDSLSFLIKNNKSTLNYPFEKLQKENALKMATSRDKKLRVYSWDTNLGGTMRFFNQIYQFNANGNIVINESLATNDPQAFFSNIYEVQTITNESIYLVISNSILSSKNVVQHINAYKITSENLKNVNVFKTKNRTLNQISVEYDFFSVVDRPERPVELITLENKTLKIALVDNTLSVTNKNLIYEWNGEAFIYKGVN